MNKKPNYKLASMISGIALLVLLVLWWISGYNFDHRGPEQAVASVLTILVVSGAFAATCGITSEM